MKEIPKLDLTEMVNHSNEPTTAKKIKRMSNKKYLKYCDEIFRLIRNNR